MARCNCTGRRTSLLERHKNKEQWKSYEMSFDVHALRHVRRKAMLLKARDHKLAKEQQERTLGQWKTPPANKLHNVTSRFMSNTTRKYIFTKYHSSITKNLNDLDFDLSRPLKVKSIGAIRLPIYGFLLMFNCNIRSSWALLHIKGFEIWVTLNWTFHSQSRSNVTMPLAGLAGLTHPLG